MSVIGGASLIHGVLLAADCRVTIQYTHRPSVRVDNLQKLIPLAPHTVLGFVGDVVTASELTQLLLKALPMRRRTDPISISQWLPRFLRHHYVAPSPPVAFMVGSVLRDHPNIVQRDSLLRMVDRIVFGDHWRQNTIPDFIMRGLMTPEQFKVLAYPQFPRTILYSLVSPNFELRPIPALHCTAIGSGGGAEEEIYAYEAAIAGVEPGAEFLAAYQLREVMRRHAETNRIDSVGGLSPAYFIHVGGVFALGLATEMPVGGARIQLGVNDRGRWVQQNLNSGKEIELVPPWEFNLRASADQLFEDLNRAYEEFMGKGTKS